MKKVNKYIVTLTILVIVAILMFLPIPIYLEQPGAAESISQYVTVNGKTNKQKGDFMLVYVAVQKATPLTYLWSFSQKHIDRVSAEEMTGGSSDAEFDRIQEYYMQDAVNSAKYVALKHAGKEVSQKYIGIYVMSVLDKSDFKNKIQVGDTITNVNGKHYSNATGYQNALAKIKAGEKVTITYQRDGKNHKAIGKTMKLPQTKRTGIGITLANRSKVKTNEKISANMEGIGGPSAGLMLSLQMYSQLSKKDLLKGRDVAGTGTIDADGKVGDIGGIDKKVISASKAHAKIFFAPDNPVSKVVKKYDPNAKSNYEEAVETAKEIHTKMKIVPVRSFNDAVNYLENN